MTTICSICARGGSTGVPGKNIKPLMGKPLIGHTIEQALAFPQIDHVFVSTDDPAIAAVAREFGAEVPFMRPAELATSTAGKLPVIEHLVDFVVSSGIEVSRIIDLDPTSPLRIPADIEACYNLLSDDVDVVITGYDAEKNPYFNMVEESPGGGYSLVKTMEETFLSRQSAPRVFAMNASIYVWWRHTLKAGLFGPRTRLHVMPRERSIDIDAPLDFEIVELLLGKRHAQ